MLGRLRRFRSFLTDSEEAYTSVPKRRGHSIAQDAVIALIAPNSGKPWDNIGPVVSAAILVELAREGRIDVSVAGPQGRRKKVTARDSTPLGDAELDTALLHIASGVFPRRATWLLNFLPDHTDILRRLVIEGIVVEEVKRGFALTRRRYHPTPAAGRDDLVVLLRSALLGESVPDDRTVLLISVIALATPLKFFVPKKQVKEANRRAGELRERLSDEERSLLEAVQLAMSNAN